MPSIRKLFLILIGVALVASGCGGEEDNPNEGLSSDAPAPATAEGDDTVDAAEGDDTAQEDDASEPTEPAEAGGTLVAAVGEGS